MTLDGLIGSLNTTLGGNMDSRLKPQQYICIFYVSFTIRFFNLSLLRVMDLDLKLEVIFNMKSLVW